MRVAPPFRRTAIARETVVTTSRLRSFGSFVDTSASEQPTGFLFRRKDRRADLLLSRQPLLRGCLWKGQVVCALLHRQCAIRDHFHANETKHEALIAAPRRFKYAMRLGTPVGVKVISWESLTTCASSAMTARKTASRHCYSAVGTAVLKTQVQRRLATKSAEAL